MILAYQRILQISLGILVLDPSPVVRPPTGGAPTKGQPAATSVAVGRCRRSCRVVPAFMTGEAEEDGANEKGSPSTPAEAEGVTAE